MRPSLQALMKSIKSKTVFIVGGGPSAKNVDFGLLQNEIVICINDSYRDFPNATAIYWVDDTWGSENYDMLNQHSCQMKFTSRHSQHMSYERDSDPTTICNAAVLRRTGDVGYDPNPDCVMGNNSGVQMLNLIVNMKPKKIILIGYDMKKNGRVSHYHNMPRPPIGDYIYNDMFMPSIDGLAKGIVKSGVKVEIINANPESAVRCFKFGNYIDYIGI